MQQRRAMDDVMADLLGKPPTYQCSGTNARGEPCGKAPMAGGKVCRDHGGAAPQVLAKAQRRSAERQAIMDARRSVLELTDRELLEAYGNPGETLQWVMAMSRAMASALHAELADHEELTYYDGFGNLHIRPEVGALLKAADQAGSHAERALRLNLDRRGLELQEKQIALLDRALDSALAQAGLSADAQRTVRTVLRAEILAAEDGTESVNVR